MPTVQLGFLDYAILFIYVAFVIGIGFALRRYMKSSSDFLTSGRSIPAWVTGLAFISANLGALELVGMAASGAKYGIATCHFYWVGAIPAMIFLAVAVTSTMPFFSFRKDKRRPPDCNSLAVRMTQKWPSQNQLGQRKKSGNIGWTTGPQPV